MSQETLQPHPAQQANPLEGGLTAEQQQRAVDLRQNLQDKEQNYRFTPEGHTVSQLWENDVRRGVRHQRQRLALHAAKKHYKKNEADYQTQAFKEATEAGVEVNGWPHEQTKDSSKKRLGNAALAMVDGATAAAFASTLVMPVAARDIIPAYVAYRFGKGTAVRGAAAVRGKGDTELALAHHVPVPMAAHGTKKQLHDKRRKGN